MFEIFDDFSIRKKGPIVDWTFQQLQNKTLGFPSTCVKNFDYFGIFTGFPFILFQEVRNVKKKLWCWRPWIWNNFIFSGSFISPLSLKFHQGPHGRWGVGVLMKYSARVLLLSKCQLNLEFRENLNNLSFISIYQHLDFSV